MNKPVRLPQLSSAKPRTGLRSFGELIECLIRQYEKQNEVEERIAKRQASVSRQNTRGKRQTVNPNTTSGASPTLTVHLGPERQTTLNFEDANVVS